MKIAQTLQLFTLVLAVAATATAQTKYVSEPRGNSIKIDGTSTLHDWEMESTLFGGFIEFGPGVTLDPQQTGIGISGDQVPATAHVIISVRAFHSKADHLPDVMDRLMQTTMKEPSFPRIDFKLTGLAFKGPHSAGKPFDFDATGDLAIAGVTNKVTFPITIEAVDAATLKISGTAPVKMTAYGIKPPEPDFGLGAMKCGDDVKIVFDWSVHKK